MSIIRERHEVIMSWLNEAAENIRRALQSELDVSQKTSPRDLVTNMDKETEDYLTGKIREFYPNDQIVSEEGFGDTVKSMEGTIWFVDPIDGTLNFVKQQENFAIMLAVYEDGVGQQSYIYDVMRDRLYYGVQDDGVYCNGERLSAPENLAITDGLVAVNSTLLGKARVEAIDSLLEDSLGVRMYGSAGIESVEVAAGRTVAYIAKTLNPWDIAPGKLMVELLGGRVLDFSGGPIDLLNPTGAIFATEQAAEIIAERLK